jgi:sugar fermentation stimulation protein A
VIGFTPPLVEGRLVRRYKRFLSDVRVGDDVVVAHCPNPGSMRSCQEEGGRIWVQAARPGRKLAWTWELAQVGDSLVCVNTARGNQLAAAAIAAGAIAELRGYPDVAREVPFGASRLDFRLSRGRRRKDELWVEVKSATMDGGAGAAAFPDAVTARGARHLDELITLRRRGARAALLFVVARAGVDRVRPADEVDPVYGAALRRAATAGVELYAYATELSPARLAITRRLPIIL